MCFRPAEISMNVCPKCGKANKPIAKTCEQCGEPLADQKFDFDADQSKLDAANMMMPSAPKAPGAPNTPGAPKPPEVPGAPKPPSAPGA